jgi:hypothetical protein
MRHDIDSWVHLCVAVCQKFGKDVYYTNMTKTLQIRQTSDVASYHQEFELLMHQLLTHNSSLDDTFFVAKFLKGLKKEIRSAIILHKPRTVDAAITLALLQESQLHDARHPRYEPRKWHNQAGPGALGPHPAEAQIPAGAAPYATQKTQLSKFAELKAQRRARGECFKCGGKYALGHKCPQQISLAVMEELYEALQLEAVSESDADPEDTGSGSDTSEEILCLSPAATQGTKGKKTLRLQGYIGKHQVLILIDSGSSGNFITSDLVERLQLPVQQLSTAHVALADGSTMLSTDGISALKWGVQQHKFEADMRVLKLKGYDIILGMEWLEKIGNGEMWVSWRRKKMRFNHEGRRITLRGITDNTAYCPRLSRKQLSHLVQHGAVAHMVQLNSATEQPSASVVPASTKCFLN